MSGLPVAWFAVVLWAGWRAGPVARPLVDGRPPPRRPFPPAAQRLAAAGSATVAVLPFVPLAAPVAGIVVWAVAVRRARLRVASAASDVVRNLPEVVDLLALAVGAGLTVPLAVAAVGRRAEGPVARAFADVTTLVGLGRRCSDVLDELPARLGEPVRPLVAALVDSERYGAPLGDALARLAADVRDDRRRQAEEAARRVPVKLLFPLVCCVLPAFALLTVAPLLAGALGSLRL